MSGSAGTTPLEQGEVYKIARKDERPLTVYVKHKTSDAHDWYRVQSWPVVFLGFEEFDLRVHRTIDFGTSWAVSEATTGMSVVKDDSSTEAETPCIQVAWLITQKKLTVEKMRDGIAKAKQHIAELGLGMVSEIASPSGGFDIEGYITGLQWSPEATEHEKALVAGNLRALFGVLREKHNVYVMMARDMAKGFDQFDKLFEQWERDGHILIDGNKVIMNRSAELGRSVIAHPDKDPDLFLCCGDGEGTHEFKVCRGYEGVAAFYEAMCGRDSDDTLDSLKRTFDDADEWRNDGTALKLELYCATFYVWKVSAAELVMPGIESATLSITFYNEVAAEYLSREPHSFKRWLDEKIKNAADSCMPNK